MQGVATSAPLKTFFPSKSVVVSGYPSTLSHPELDLDPSHPIPVSRDALLYPNARSGPAVGEGTAIAPLLRAP